MNPSGVIEGLPLARALRDLPWLYPAIGIVHLCGMAILVGSVVMFDLRVLGLAKHISARALSRFLLPWSWAALLLVVPTGMTMFTAHAQDFLNNPAFKWKMALLVAALMNTAYFHTGPFQGVAAWDHDATAPIDARLSAALSIAIWLGVISCGRVLSYR
jgi:hypothetical protein